MRIGMGHKAIFAANSLSIAKKSNALGCPRPWRRSRQGVLQRFPNKIHRSSGVFYFFKSFAATARLKPTRLFRTVGDRNMTIKFFQLAAWIIMILCTAASHAAIVGPVNVLSQVNDGSRPAVCVGSLNVNIGGVSEMSLDLDQDGVADVCFGSATNNCSAGFNYDALSLNTTKLMATGDVIMNGANATLTFWNGQAVGPFQATSGSINSANIGQPDVPMVFGFQGGSNTAATDVGYFSFTVKSADCSISFGKVDIAAGANTFSNAVAASTATATPVPFTSPIGLLLMTSLIGLFGVAQVRGRKG